MMSRALFLCTINKVRVIAIGRGSAAQFFSPSKKRRKVLQHKIYSSLFSFSLSRHTTNARARKKKRVRSRNDDDDDDEKMMTISTTTAASSTRCVACCSSVVFRSSTKNERTGKSFCSLLFATKSSFRRGETTAMSSFSSSSSSSSSLRRGREGRRGNKNRIARRSMPNTTTRCEIRTSDGNARAAGVLGLSASVRFCFCFVVVLLFLVLCLSSFFSILSTLFESSSSLFVCLFRDNTTLLY